MLMKPTWPTYQMKGGKCTRTTSYAVARQWLIEGKTVYVKRGKTILDTWCWNPQKD